MRILLAAALALSLAACNKKGEPPADETTTAAPPSANQPAPPPAPPANQPAPTPAAPAVQPTEVRASHILLMYVGSMRAPASVTRTKEQARTEADQILQKVRANADFAALASQVSDCPSKARGGDLGRFPKGVMHPAFEAAAFALPVGGLSGVVETPFGYHVIKRTE